MNTAGKFKFVHLIFYAIQKRNNLILLLFFQV